MSLKHSDEFKRDAVRIALTSGLTRRQVASDLSIGLSTLGKWIASISDELKFLPKTLIFCVRMNVYAKRTVSFGRRGRY